MHNVTSRAVCKSYNKSILRVGQYGGIFSCRLQYCLSLRSAQYCQPQTEYEFPVLPSQSCSNIYLSEHYTIESGLPLAT